MNNCHFRATCYSYFKQFPVQACIQHCKLRKQKKINQSQLQQPAHSCIVTLPQVTLFICSQTHKNAKNDSILVLQQPLCSCFIYEISHALFTCTTDNCSRNKYCPNFVLPCLKWKYGFWTVESFVGTVSGSYRGAEKWEGMWRGQLRTSMLPQWHMV